MFGWSMGDVVSISTLAMKVYTAYKDAPNDYRHISQEVKSLKIIIDKAKQLFENSIISDKNHQDDQEILQSCRSVLEDLSSLIERYRGLTSTNSHQIFKRVKFGTEDIATLRVRLISNTGLLNGFIQRFDILTIAIKCTVLIFTSAVKFVRYGHC